MPIVMLATDLILTITAGLGSAAVLGYVTKRLGLSPIVGYLLAGILVGPYTPGFVADQAIADQLAEIGVILLMFGVGMQFHVRELLAVKAVALPGAVVQSAVATLLGLGVGLLLGWHWHGGLVFGLAVSVASTVVLLRVLSDHHDLHTPAGHIAVGWLVVEDLFTVLALVLLPILLAGAGGQSVVEAVAWSTGKLVLLAALIALAGSRLLPRLLERVSATGSRELFILAVLALALGIAVGSAKLFGVSMALGAFLAGLVVGRSEFALRAANEALPLRDAFAVLFFVAVGMLFSPADLLASPGLALMTLAIVLVAKPVAALAIVLVLRRPLHTGLAVAVALAQIGEFSFMLMALGREHGVIGDAAANAIIAAAIISIALNPLLYRLIGPTERLIGGQPRLAAWIDRRSRPSDPGRQPAPAADPSGPVAVVVGAGPAGRTLVPMLRANGITPVVIEMNLETVRQLRRDGIQALYGDAVHPGTLDEAGIARAIALFLTSAGMDDAPLLVRRARVANPALHIMVRTAYLREAAGLRAAGADHVITGEGEIAWAMAEALLLGLGSDPARIAAERNRVRAELGTAPPGLAMPLGEPRQETGVAATAP